MTIVHAMICIFGTALALFVIYLFVRFMIGFSIAKHLHLFGVIYDDIYSQTEDRIRAFETAFIVFRTCPGLRKLTAEEAEAAFLVLCLAPDPKWVIEKVMLKLDSRHLLQAFRDLNFLSKVVDVGMKRG